MKFIILSSILIIFQLLNLISASPKLKNNNNNKNTTKKQTLKKFTNKTITHKNDIINNQNQNSNYSHISNHNAKFIEKFHLISAKNYSRKKQDFNEKYESKPLYWGVCMIKYKGHIINIYPLTEENDNGTFFIKTDSTIFDFDFCKDVYTHSERKGLFVNKYENIVYAGSAKEDKYFYIDEKQEDVSEPEKLRSENRNNLNGLSERNCKKIFTFDFFFSKLKLL